MLYLGQLYILVCHKPVEIKLAADFRVWATSVRDVVAVEGHHVGQHVSGVIVIWNWSSQLVRAFISLPSKFSHFTTQLHL